MWPPWGAVPRGGAAQSPPPAQPSFAFSFSFKDVPALIHDEPDTDPNPPPQSAASSVFHRIRSATSALRLWRAAPPSPPPPPAAEKRIVVYFTSLRVVRKTFEDCSAVRSILRGFRVAVDERDLSMDSGFLSEVKGVLGRSQLTLPIVFIGGRYVGGADEIRHLHESGELKKCVEGVPTAAPGICDGCGGFRFVLCENCSGSRKLYSDKSGGFRSCALCNENGLVKCPDCSPSDLL
ncbi:glutaredoxin family protein [Wolffia australiana]